MSLDGGAVSYGVVDSDLFIDRVEYAEKMIRRTAERKLGKPFSEHGRKSKKIQELKTYLAVPRAASFSISIRVGASHQLDLPGIGYPEGLIDEIMDCLRLFQEGEDETLQNKIGDERYFRNFLGLARQLAPDGENVRMVGFTTMRDEKPHSVKITRTRSEIPESETKQPPKEFLKKPIEVTGELLYADATTDESEIRLVVEDKKKTYHVIVPEGMMSDIVKPLWEEMVTVKGIEEGNRIILEDIWKA